MPVAESLSARIPSCPMGFGFEWIFLCPSFFPPENFDLSLTPVPPQILFLTAVYLGPQSRPHQDSWVRFIGTANRIAGHVDVEYEGERNRDEALVLASVTVDSSPRR